MTSLDFHSPLWDPTVAAAHPDVIGGKARGLLQLAATGVPTPLWGGVPAAVVAARAWDGVLASPYLAILLAEGAKPGFAGLAVRSSALHEDGSGASFAGLFETRFVPGIEELAAALDAVADSASASRARDYGAGGGMALVLQAAVTAQWSGVAFSVSPTAARADEACIEIVTGAGEALVSGDAEPGRVVLHWPDGAVLSHEAGPDGPKALPPDLAASLTGWLGRLEEGMGCLVDLEWVHNGRSLYAVQARPMTALSPGEEAFPDCCMTSWFFDQRFQDPITPFSQSTLLPLIEDTALRDALAMRGHEAPPQLIHYFGGQAYVPHGAWRKMLGGAPRWWLSDDLRALFPARCFCEAGGQAWAWPFGYGWAALKAVWKHRRDVFGNLPAWDAFAGGLAEELQVIRALPEDTEDRWREKWRACDALSTRFLAIHRWSILWADYLYRAFRLILRAMPDKQAQAIQHRFDHSVGLATVAANRALAQWLATGATPEDFPTAYGDRSTSLDYAAPTWTEMATTGRLGALYGGLAAESAKAARPIPGLGLLRRFIELREEQRLHWERILAVQRQMALALGHALVATGSLAKREEIWLLRLDEALAWRFRGDGPEAEVREARRRQQRIDRLIPTPLFIGPAHAAAASADDDAGRVWKGIGASTGVARGRAQIVNRPEDFRASDEAIILVAQALDPAWTPLLPQVAGVVLERGGVLSHASVIAREYGTPLVVGIADACTRIAQGGLVELDGGRGVVRILDAASGEFVDGEGV